MPGTDHGGSSEGESESKVQTVLIQDQVHMAEALLLQMIARERKGNDESLK